MNVSLIKFIESHACVRGDFIMSPSLQITNFRSDNHS